MRGVGSARRPTRPAGVLVALLALAGLTGGCLQGGSRGGAIWVAGGDDEILSDSPPAPESAAFSARRGEARLLAAANETLGLQVAVAGGGFGRSLTVHVTDFVGPPGRLPASEIVRVYRAQYVEVTRFASWYPEHTGRDAVATLFPDKLVPWEAPRGGGPLRASGTRNEIAWVDLHVPPATAPGTYRARLTVGTPAGGSAAGETQHGARTPPASIDFACDIVLDVLPIALPTDRHLSTICRVDPSSLLRAHLNWPETPAEQARLLPEEPRHAEAVALVGETFRLLQAHRTNPVLWASFPKYRPVARDSFELDWAPYDDLVTGWLDGTAFDDEVPLSTWLLPTSLDYPSAAQNGGLGSVQHVRALRNYLTGVQDHFAERGWLDRCLLRLVSPEALTEASVRRAAAASAAAEQALARVPLVAHLPPRSLRGLGWRDAPAIDLAPGSWATPAMWLEPEELTRQTQAGRRVWIMPDEPPYSGSLATEAPPTDARILPWLAYRYGADGLWVEHAADNSAASASAVRERWIAPPLVYPGAEFGLRTQPVPSIRLKRLLRGLQDYELLRLLEQNGQGLLARRVCEQVVRWGLAGACRDNVLTTRGAGWPMDPFALDLARTLLLIELAGEAAEDGLGTMRRQARSEWGALFTPAQRVAVEVDGARLLARGDEVVAQVLLSVFNDSAESLTGEWSLSQPPPGWSAADTLAAEVPRGSARTARLMATPTRPAFSSDGCYPFETRFDTATLGSFERQGRLALLVCPALDASPRIDGRLDDWPLAEANTAGDFRLVRGGADSDGAPTLPTQAFVACDDKYMYVGVRCELRFGERPVWTADNTISIDGAIPWGQDLVELLFDPRPTVETAASDLLCMQIKPSGVVVAQRGCRTDPPIAASVPWSAGERVAVSVSGDAWVIEAAIPLDAFGPEARTNRLWGFNITRLDARRGQYSAWSGARGHAYRPHSLGNLVLPWPVSGSGESP